MSDQRISPHDYLQYGKRTSSTAVLSLVFGIASYFVVPLLGAIAAIIMGHLARKEIRENPDQITGEGFARWGLILGWINVAISIFGLCLAVFVLLLTILTAVGMVSVPMLLLPLFNNGGF
jgi:uncharacterized membrane protein